MARIPRGSGGASMGGGGSRAGSETGAGGGSTPSSSPIARAPPRPSSRLLGLARGRQGRQLVAHDVAQGGRGRARRVALSVGHFLGAGGAAEAEADLPLGRIDA